MPVAAIISREQHCISRQNINANALKVLYRLHKAGFKACLVGGSVRDLLQGKKPKDFDIATNAHPDRIRHLFQNCRLVGRRFRLAHIHFGREIIEVATFRSEHNREQQHLQSGMVLQDNVYGSIEEDALRRDFTVNALYYNIADFSVIDYSGGLQDLQRGVLRLIGNPEQRYREDPVRMLRAIRFAAKLGFTIESQTEQPLYTLGELLQGISSARLFEETLKLFLSSASLTAYRLLCHYQLFKWLFAQAASQIEQATPIIGSFIELTFKNTDQRIQEQKTVNPAFIFAALLWYPLQNCIQKYHAEGMRPLQALNHAVTDILPLQLKQIAIPRRLILCIREIWDMQIRFSQKQTKRAYKLVEHPRFRAAYDFLLLRAVVDPCLKTVSSWWQDFYEGDSEKRALLLKAITANTTKKKTKKPPKSEIKEH